MAFTFLHEASALYYHSGFSHLSRLWSESYFLFVILVLVTRHGCAHLLLVLVWIRARQCSKDEAFLARLSSEWKFCQKYSLFYY